MIAGVIMAKSLVKTVTVLTNEAAVAWKALNGILIAYKPAPMHVATFEENIKKKLCGHLNAMKQAPLGKHVSIIGPTNEDMIVEVHEDYSEHPLAIGPAYQPCDITMKTANYLSKDASGVLIIGLNKGTSLIDRIKRSKPTKLYRVKGLFGQGTSNCFTTGRVVVKSSYKHIKRYALEKMCASMQSTHQKKIFDLIGVDVQSEAAYQLAIQGPIKPIDEKIPMVYSIKCVDFNPPEFVLEIVCINEQEDYLKILIDTIGLKLHTNATCTQLKCLQYGFFHINQALVINQMELENVLEHMRQSERIIKTNRRFLRRNTPILRDSRKTPQEC